MARASGYLKEETFNFRVPADLKAAFQKITEKEDRPAAQVIRDFMRAYVLEHQEPEAQHDVWFRKQVEIALDTPFDTTTHSDVMNKIRRLIKKLDKGSDEGNMT